MDAKQKSKNKKLKQSHNEETTASTLLVADDETSANNTNKNERFLALQSRFHATTQLGGKGTMRRRRLRRTIPLLSAELANTEHMRSFVKKFDFADYGQMESVSFVESRTGKVTTYDSVNLMANIKSGMFHFNFAKYKNVSHHRRRSAQAKRDASTREKSPSPAPTSLSASVHSSGVHVETAENLLRKLQTSGASEVLALVGLDAHEYLSNFVSRSNLENQFIDDEENKSTLIVDDGEDYEDIPNLTNLDFESSSQITDTQSQQQSHEISLVIAFKIIII
jgi:hypothetical protein